MKRYSLGNIAIVIAVVVLAGCEDPSSWRYAPQNRACTAEQMQKAQAEALWCKTNTDFLDTYCYGAAIMRNCELKQ